MERRANTFVTGVRTAGVRKTRRDAAVVVDALAAALAAEGEATAQGEQLVGAVRRRDAPRVARVELPPQAQVVREQRAARVPGEEEAAPVEVPQLFRRPRHNSSRSLTESPVLETVSSTWPIAPTTAFRFSVRTENS
jgi:hypothetical protein